MKVEADKDMDPSALAKTLDGVKSKSADVPKGKRVGDGDCDCSEVTAAMKAKSAAAVE